MTQAKEMIKQLINDIRWMILVTKARRYRRELMFSQRTAFDVVLRHVISSDERNRPTAFISYPDAFYYITEKDLKAAMQASLGFTPVHPKIRENI